MPWPLGLASLIFYAAMKPINIDGRLEIVRPGVWWLGGARCDREWPLRSAELSVSLNIMDCAYSAVCGEQRTKAPQNETTQSAKNRLCFKIGTGPPSSIRLLSQRAVS